MENKPTSSPTSFVDQSVVSGDVVLDLSNMTNQTLKLGGGLRQDCDAISVMKAGKLRFSKPNKYWVESSQKRYVPHAGDSVLGIVVDSKADNFLVDIKGPGLAFLPVLAFEGGTRRNIPKFEIVTQGEKAERNAKLKVASSRSFCWKIRERKPIFLTHTTEDNLNSGLDFGANEL